MSAEGSVSLAGEMGWQHLALGQVLRADHLSAPCPRRVGRGSGVWPRRPACTGHVVSVVKPWLPHPGHQCTLPASSPCLLCPHVFPCPASFLSHHRNSSCAMGEGWKCIHLHSEAAPASPLCHKASTCQVSTHSILITPNTHIDTQDLHMHTYKDTCMHTDTHIWAH